MVANKISIIGSASRIALAVVLLGGAPLAAHAQMAKSAAMAAAGGGASDIDELVVTARKRSERLRDIPTAATALGADDIKDLGGLPNAQALLAAVPGVNFANTSNPLTSDLSIRGSGTSRATNAEAGVGIYRDGAFLGGGNVAGRTFIGIDLFDVERVEILRGVQGGLAGRNAEGGSFNVITARPTHEFSGYLFGTVASQQHGDIEAVFNLPINDNWATRFSFEGMDQEKGFYHLYVINKYADAAWKQYFRGQVAYTNGKFNANLLLERGNERTPGLVYQVVTFANANFPKGYYSDKYDTSWNSPSSGRNRSTTGELTINYDMDWAQFSSVTTSRDRRGQNQYDRDALSPEFIFGLIAAGQTSATAPATLRTNDYGLGGDQVDHARIFYQDAHLAGSDLGGMKSLNWVAGGEYYQLNDTPSSILAKTPNYPAGNLSQGTLDRGKLQFHSYAFYGSLAYDVLPTLNASGDLRYTKDKEDFLTKRYDFGTNVPSAVTAFNNSGSRSQGNWSYTATLGWKPIANQLLYAKIGSAYRAGGFNGNLGDARQPIPVPGDFDNETVTAYEVGYKGNLLPWLYGTLAAYENHYNNLVIQGVNGCAVSNPVCPVQATSFAFNAGPAHLYGVEVELTARTELAGGNLRATVGGSKQGGHITGGIDKGLRQPQQPDYTGTFSVMYRHDLWSGVNGFISFNGNARKGGVQEVAQTPPLANYVSFNGRMGATWGKYELTLYSNNLGQASYLVFSAPSATGDVRRYNLPRTYGAQLRYTW